MQNTFSQSGNDSKWFLKKSFFKIGKWHSRPPRDPPLFMANAILNFHFDFLTPSLKALTESEEKWCALHCAAAHCFYCCCILTEDEPGKPAYKEQRRADLTQRAQSCGLHFSTCWPDPTPFLPHTPTFSPQRCTISGMTRHFLLPIARYNVELKAIDKIDEHMIFRF